MRHAEPTTKPYALTDHACRRVLERRIAAEDVKRAVESPFARRNEADGLEVRHVAVARRHRHAWLAVVVAPGDTDELVVTAYVLSRSAPRI